MEMAEIIQIISIGLLWSQLLLIMDNFFLFCLQVTISEFMCSVRAINSFFSIPWRHETWRYSPIFKTLENLKSRIFGWNS